MNSTVTGQLKPNDSSLRGAGPAPLVFVVDDDRMLAQITLQLVQAAGFTAKCFNDGKLARIALETDRNRPGILITDYDLGDMEGFDLISTARKFIPEIRCLLVSGSVNQEFLRTHPVRPDYFLPKPYRAAEFLEVLGIMRAEAALAASAD